MNTLFYNFMVLFKKYELSDEESRTIKLIVYNLLSNKYWNLLLREHGESLDEKSSIAVDGKYKNALIEIGSYFDDYLKRGISIFFASRTLFENVFIAEDISNKNCQQWGNIEVSKDRKKIIRRIVRELLCNEHRELLLSIHDTGLNRKLSIEADEKYQEAIGQICFNLSEYEKVGDRLFAEYKTFYENVYNRKDSEISDLDKLIVRCIVEKFLNPEQKDLLKREHGNYYKERSGIAIEGAYKTIIARIQKLLNAYNDVMDGDPEMPLNIALKQIEYHRAYFSFEKRVSAILEKNGITVSDNEIIYELKCYIDGLCNEDKMDKYQFLGMAYGSMFLIKIYMANDSKSRVRMNTVFKNDRDYEKWNINRSYNSSKLDALVKSIAMRIIKRHKVSQNRLSNDIHCMYRLSKNNLPFFSSCAISLEELSSIFGAESTDIYGNSDAKVIFGVIRLNGMWNNDDFNRMLHMSYYEVLDRVSKILNSHINSKCDYDSGKLYEIYKICLNFLGTRQGSLVKKRM